MGRGETNIEKVLGEDSKFQIRQFRSRESVLFGRVVRKPSQTIRKSVASSETGPRPRTKEKGVLVSD